MNKTISILKYLIGWPLSLVSLIFIIKLIFSNFNSLASLKNINIGLLSLGIFCFLVYFFLRALLWEKIIKKRGNLLSYKKTSYLWEISEIKRYTPGNIWSFLSRTKLFSDNNISVKDVASSLVSEIILILLGCFSLSFFYLSDFIKTGYFSWSLFALNIFILVFYIFDKKIINKFFDKNTKEEKISIYLISLLCFFMFGIATYFSAASIVYLDPKNILNLISLFVFALLIGYLSIVTPMGLGVREGVTTLGLSTTLPLYQAGLISIFTRIIFIFSEAIFLSIIFAWEKVSSKIILRVEGFIKNHKHEVLLLVFIVLYCLYFATASFLRHDNFFSGRFDLGNMDQTVWNTIHGKVFQMTDPNATETVFRLNFHSDLILVLISPLYLIWSNPKMLLFLQTIILAVGSIFVFLIGKQVLKEKSLSLAFAIVYLFNPSVQYANLYDFHAVTLATTFLLATFYYFLKKKYFLFLLFGILSGLCKEEIWVIISLFGVSIVLRTILKNRLNVNLKKERALEIVFGSFVAIISWLIFYLLIWLIIPNLRGVSHFALSYYSDFGDSPSEIIKNILFSPIKTIFVIFSPDRLEYLLKLFLPFGFTSFLSPVFLIFAAPDLLINLLSSNRPLHEIYYQYTSAITPFIVISSIYGVYFLNKRLIRIGSKLSVYFLISTTLISGYLFGPLPGSLHANIEMFNQQLSYRGTIDQFISNIPQNYSISASNNLGSHLSQRKNLFNIPVGFDRADMILFLLNDYYAQPSLASQRQMVAQLKNNKNYVLVFEEGDFVAFKKRSLVSLQNVKLENNKKNSFQYSIDALLARDYKKSEIKIENEVSSSGNFKSYVISFDSDGLKEYALMNIPNSPKPTGGYPVLILNHGYIQPSIYSTMNSYKTDSDYFANQGLLVIKPDYRGNANSETADKALMRFAYPIDVLNLIESVPNIEFANSNQVFLWSHSMGGEVTLTVLEVASQNKELSNKIKGAVFWAPVTEPSKWFSRNHLPSLPEARISPYPYSQTFQILGTPEENPKLWSSLSPLNYLKNINVPILLQHGTGDNTVPYSWSIELNSKLSQLNKNINFISYPGDDHNLPRFWNEAVSKDVEFYNEIIAKSKN